MRLISKYFAVIILLTVLSCSNNNDSSGAQMSEKAMLAPEYKESTDVSIDRKLIKEGRVEFETDNLSSTRKIIFDAINKYKAYVTSDQEFISPGRKSNSLVIHVPADNFDNLLKDATQGVDKFEIKEINAEDVTEEFLDIQVRIKTKKELETRYLDLLKQAKNVLEILEIEKQIAQLRADIESIEGRLQYLENRISFSTLTMTFYESLPNETEFGQKFKNGFKNGWNNFIWFFVFLTNIWLFIVIGVLLIIGIRVYRRRKNK